MKNNILVVVISGDDSQSNQKCFEDVDRFFVEENGTLLIIEKSEKVVAAFARYRWDFVYWDSINES